MSAEARDIPCDNRGVPLNLKQCCLNVRHKLMYVDPAHATPGIVDDNSESRVYLCVLTQEVLGPDGKLVTPSNCSPGRSCYCGAAKAAPRSDLQPEGLI